jgi:flagellar FliL protein
MPKVRDAINLLLSSKTYADLATMESKILLKNEIVERLNQILGGSKVTRVYFTEIVIQ